MLTLFNALMLIATLVILKYLKPTRKPPPAPLTGPQLAAAKFLAVCGWALIRFDAVLLCSAPCGWRSSLAAEPARTVRAAFAAPGQPAFGFCARCMSCLSRRCSRVPACAYCLLLWTGWCAGRRSSPVRATAAAASGLHSPAASGRGGRRGRSAAAGWLCVRSAPALRLLPCCACSLFPPLCIRGAVSFRPYSVRFSCWVLDGRVCGCCAHNGCVLWFLLVHVACVRTRCVMWWSWSQQWPLSDPMRESTASSRSQRLSYLNSTESSCSSYT